MPLLPSQWNNDIQAVSMQPVQGNPEYVIPLWWLSANPSVFNGTIITGGVLLKGVLTPGTSFAATPAKLHTLNSNWLAATKFAIEFSAYCQSASDVCNVSLYDITAGSEVVASRTTFTGIATSVNVFRSTQFTLIPGHSYGIGVWSNTAGAGHNIGITDVSLIVFPQ